MTIRFVSNEKIAETSSKGNQEKWLEQGNLLWGTPLFQPSKRKG